MVHKCCVGHLQMSGVHTVGKSVIKIEFLVIEILTLKENNMYSVFIIRITIPTSVSRMGILEV